MACQQYFPISAAQEGREVFGQAAAKDPEEEGRFRWWQSQKEGKTFSDRLK